MRYCSRAVAFGTFALGLTACAATPNAGPPPAYYEAKGVVSADTAKLSDGDYVSPAWVSETFDGTHTRTLTGNRLNFTVDNRADSQGGWDGGVSLRRGLFGDVAVRDVGEGAVACTSYHVDMQAPDGATSSWWAGPKVSINWAAMESADNPGDWYENYIVETGSQTPEEWLVGMRGWTDVEDLGSTVIEGATYRHFKMRFKSWWQFWSFRVDQRAAGAVPLRPILDVWVEHGMPDTLRVDGVKANVETHGPMRAAGQIAATFNTGGLSAPTGSCDVPTARVEAAP